MNMQSANDQNTQPSRIEESGQETGSGKKLYRKPTLVEYGNIVEITKASSLMGMADGGTMLLMMMSM